jgi:hypothetical protein
VSTGFVAPRLDRLAEHAGAFLCAFAFEEMRPFTGATGLVDWRLHGHLSRLRIRGFLTGELGEALLVPLGERLPPIRLVLLGLGPRDSLDAARCQAALHRMFEVVGRLGDAPLLIALPGRPEQVTDPAAAVTLFLDAYDERGADRRVALLEPTAAQKAMLPIIERHRLKMWVPMMTME